MTTTTLYALLPGTAAGGGLWLTVDTGHAYATSDTATVNVTHRQRTRIPSLTGIDHLVTTGHATARAEQDITTPWLQGRP